MKKFLPNILVMTINALAFNLSAQTVTQIGTGTQAPLTNNSIYSPICRFSASSGNDCSRSNLLYTNTELNNAGITNGATIDKIAFYKIGTGASTAGFTFEIYMRNATTTAPLSATTWATILTTHTQVYTTTSQTIPATSGWVEFTLTTPFVYTGQNLEIAMSHNMTAISGNPTTGAFDWQYTNGFQDYIIGAVSTSPPANLNGTVTNYKVRPNIQFTYTPNPLSVKLSNFIGEKQGSINKLKWETEAENENEGFEVQRSANGTNFTTLEFIPAKQKIKSENGKQSYSFDDTHPANGANYYRLKQISTGDKLEFSKVIMIKGTDVSSIKVTSLFPNPTCDQLNATIETTTNQQVLVIISDIAGKILIQQHASLSAGEHNVIIPVASLPAGQYYLRLTCSENCYQSIQSFIKK